MTIKEFASKLGVSDSALRYYERIGVLKPIRRRKNGYREFTETDIAWMDAQCPSNIRLTCICGLSAMSG